jgi:hypothetical protein
LNNAIIFLKSGNRVLLDIYPHLSKASSIAESKDESFRVKVIDYLIDEKSTAYTILAIEKLRMKIISTAPFIPQNSICTVETQCTAP